MGYVVANLSYFVTTQVYDLRKRNLIIMHTTDLNAGMRCIKYLLFSFSLLFVVSYQYVVCITNQRVKLSLSTTT